VPSGRIPRLNGRRKRETAFPTYFRHQLCIVVQRTESWATSVVFQALFFSKLQRFAWLRTERSGVRISPGAPKKHRDPFGSLFFCGRRVRTRSPVGRRFDKSAMPIWTHEVRPEGVRAAGPNQSLRARQIKKGSHRDPFFILCVRDEAFAAVALARG
jgi:hypothetical protein